MNYAGRKYNARRLANGCGDASSVTKEDDANNGPTYWLHSLVRCNQIRVGFSSSSDSDVAKAKIQIERAAYIGEREPRMK